MKESKRFSRRDFLRLSSVAATGAILAACAPEVIEKEVTVEVEVPVEQTVIVKEEVRVEVDTGPTNIRFTVWYGQGDIETWDLLIDAFEDLHPSVKVDFEPLAWNQYWQKVQVGFAAGDVQDVIGMAMCYDYAARDQLLALDPYIEAGQIDRLQWFESLMPNGIWPLPDGELFALPYRFTGSGFFINKTLFDEAGVEYPEEGWTWPTDYLEKALALTDPAKEVWGTKVAVAQFMGPWLFTNETEALTPDARHSNFLDPKLEEAYQFQADLVCKHEVAPKPEDIAGMGDLFLSGKLAMNPSALWNLPAYRKIEDFEWDIVYDPVKDGVNKPGPWYGPDSLSITAAAQHPDAGWEFLLFATGSPEGQRIMAATGIPTLKTEANNPDFLAAQSEAGPASFALVMDHAAEGKPFSSSPAWTEWMSVLNQTMGEVYNCNMPLQEALPIIDEGVEEVLAEAYAELDSL